MRAPGCDKLDQEQNRKPAPGHRRTGRAEYVTMAVDETIPACAPHTKWIDVFCERGAFTLPCWVHR